MIASVLVPAAESAEENFASFDVPLWVWGASLGAIVAMLVVDLLLVHRTAHVITFKEAAIESAIWIAIGLAFGVVSWSGRAARPAASTTPASSSRRASPSTTSSSGR